MLVAIQIIAERRGGGLGFSLKITSLTYLLVLSLEFVDEVVD